MYCVMHFLFKKSAFMNLYWNLKASFWFQGLAPGRLLCLEIIRTSWALVLEQPGHLGLQALTQDPVH